MMNDLNENPNPVNPKSIENIQVGDFIIFTIGNKKYALSTQNVKEIIQIPEIRTIPKLPAEIEGIFLYQKKIVTVLNSSFLKFEHPNPLKGEEIRQKYPKLIIVQHSGELLGLRIDNMHQMIENVSLQTILFYQHEKTTLPNVISSFFSLNDEHVFILQAKILFENIKNASNLDKSNIFGVKKNQNRTLTSSWQSEIQKETFLKTQLQKGYSLPENILQKFDITNSDLDIFRELGNMAVGQVSKYVSHFSAKKVFLEVPPTKLEIPPLSPTLTDLPADTKTITQNFTFSTPFTFQILVITPKIEFSHFLQHFLQESSKTNPGELTVKVFFDHLITDYIKGISDFLALNKLDPHFTSPIVEDKAPIQLEELIKDQDLHPIIVTKTGFRLDWEKPFRTWFYLLVDIPNAKNIKAHIATLW